MKKLKVGITGIGRFGEFLLSAYKELKDIKIYAICSRNENKIRKIAKKYNIPHICTDYKKLLKIKEIDIIVIATPPFLHAQMIINALNAKKHVLCEKPLALNLQQAKKIKKAINKNKKLFTIDYILRENELIKKVKKIINEKIFGSVQNFTFENFASDSHLSPTHWFWDKTKSGGIWIEHGVHFFDIFHYLLDQKCKKIISFSIKRNKKIEDQVSAICVYNNGTQGTFLNSFTKPYQIEETSYCLSFDKGDIRIRGWIPVEINIEGLINNKEHKKLKTILKQKGKSTIKEIEKEVRGRGRYYDVSKKIKTTIKLKDKKETIYKESIKKIMLNLVRAIQKKERLNIEFEEAYESLTDAIKAEKNKIYTLTL